MELAASYSDNVRYQLAKQQLEQNFLKWISQDNVHTFVNKLIGEVKNPTSNILSPPAPIFVTKTPTSPKTNGGGVMGEFGRSPHTPPRSPSGEGKYFKTLVNPDFEPITNEEETIDAARTLTRNQLKKVIQDQVEIPKFYFADPKPDEENIKIINDIFEDKPHLEAEEFQPI